MVALIGWTFGAVQLFVFMYIFLKIGATRARNLEAKEKLQRIQRRNTVRTRRQENAEYERQLRESQKLEFDASNEEVRQTPQTGVGDSDWVPR